ncbi:MAG: ParB/RepB/Spo0J family partition protein [Planctomycetota bacterium]|jgi:ParB family chromosome partitioning protein
MSNAKKDKPKHLGRGLQSLLGPITSGRVEIKTVPPTPAAAVNFPPDKELQNSLYQIDIEHITENPFQPRANWDEQELSDLAESIKTNGVIQPIIVRKHNNKYQLIAGERRFRAAKMASLKTIPAIVRSATDEQLLELALVENIHRSDLNPVERAKAYQKYIKTFSLTQAEAATRLGEDRSVVANYLRLLDLPSEIRQMLIDGQLSAGHARAILALPTDELRRKLANRAMAGRLSVRDVERLVRRYLTTKEEVKKQAKAKSAHIAELENQLSKELGTRVSIDTRKNGQRGKIVIEFYSLDDFDRIAERLGMAVAEHA